MITLLYVTHPNEEHALRISRVIVEEKLAACTNVFPIQSIYPWEGNIQSESEYVSILKTFPGLKDKAIKRMGQLHEYEVPCILSFEVNVNAEYENWLLSCLS